MEFFKHEDGKLTPLAQKNVDTGLGLERVNMLLQGKETPYDTEIFIPILKKLEQLQKVDEIYSRRIVAEHLRSSIMIICDGGRPSNIDRGYVLRRLIRRMIRHLNKLQISLDELSGLIELNIETLKEMYPDLEKNKEAIKSVILEEKDKFVKTLAHGEKEFTKEMNKAIQNQEKIINGQVVFKLYDTYGFPPEVTKELAEENGFEVDLKEFEKLFKAHQEKSRLGAEQKFKGGLASTGEMETKYHTATHLLNAALKQVLGSHVHQRGSNITADRMRFDFSHDSKMTDEEKKQAEDLVNKYIEMAIPVERLEMKKDEAIAMGAEAMFLDKYGDIVTVYKIGDVSIELCGGPHVKNTSELGKFKIKKEESSSSGVRRIKAILEK
jgi:alanyl-tRNA synthetase